MDKNILMFLSGEYSNSILTIEQYLPLYLSGYKHIVCFEHPRFLNFVKILIHKLPIYEKLNNNLSIFHSIAILPFGRYLMPINYINYFLSYLLFIFLVKFQKNNISIISFTPEFIFLDNFFLNKSIYYHVVDNYKTLPVWNNLLQHQQFNWLEKNMVKIASKIIVVSDNLRKKYVELHKMVILFPTPTNLMHYFQLEFKKDNIPIDLKTIPKPIVGYIGTIRDYNIDTDLLSKVAIQYPKISFVFLGLIDKNSLRVKKIIADNSNCYYLGCYRPEILPSYVNIFDVCMIPYKTDAFGYSSYPVKIMEYLSVGKPVVTTALPSIKYLSDNRIIYWAKNDEEFIKYIDLALHEGRNKKLIQERIDESKKNDWNMKIKEYLNIIENRS